MARIVLSRSAAADETNILIDLHARAGLATAVKFRELFRALYDRLAVFPAGGPLRPALGVAVRIGVVPPFVVIHQYSPRDDTVTVLRIVHGRRDVTRKLLTDPDP